MAIEAKMMYVLAKIECNYTLKHVFDDKILHNKSMLDIKIAGVQLHHSLALDSKTSSKFELAYPNNRKALLSKNDS